MTLAIDPSLQRLAGEFTLAAVAAEEKRRRCVISLSEFVREAWHVVEPATRYVHNWHIDAICEHLQAIDDGRIHNLVINVPPGHMKSLLVNVFWPAWMWLHRPSWRGLFATYAQTLTLRDAAKCRFLIKSDWYQTTFKPDWTISIDQDAKFFFQNTRLGFRYSMSVGSETTGHRGDCIAVDDPLNAADSASDTAIANVLWWWDQAMANRLNDLTNGSRVIIMQRLHEMDLAGHVLKGGGWEHLRLPTEFEPAEAAATSIGWRDPRIGEGELLFPERFTPVSIDEEKRRLGSSGFAGQHQQRPSPAGGGKFQRRWFRYYEDEGAFYVLHRPEGGDQRVLKRETWRFQTADLALSEKEENCYTVIATWAVTQQMDILLLEIDRFRKEAPDVEAALQTDYMRWQPAFQGVEKAHFGAAICQRFIRLGLPLKELIADRDKISRAIPAAVMMENGKFYFPLDAPWLAEYERELLLFPNGQFADQVDVTAYAGIVVAQQAGVTLSDVLRGEKRAQVVETPAGPEAPRTTPRRARWEDVTG